MKEGLCSSCDLCLSVYCSWLCDEHIKGLKACSGYEERVRFILCFASFCVLQLVMWQAQGKVISLLSLLKKGGHVRVSARLLRLLVHRTGSKKKDSGNNPQSAVSQHYLGLVMCPPPPPILLHSRFPITLTEVMLLSQIKFMSTTPVPILSQHSLQNGHVETPDFPVSKSALCPCMENLSPKHYCPPLSSVA